MITDRLLKNITHTTLFANYNKSKFITLGFLIISLMGAAGKKEEKLSYKAGIVYIVPGLIIYFFSYYILLSELLLTTKTVIYIGITGGGYLLVLSGGNLLSRVIKKKLSSRDVFNKENETFPQEERLLQNEYEFTLQATENCLMAYKNASIIEAGKFGDDSFNCNFATQMNEYTNNLVSEVEKYLQSFKMAVSEFAKSKLNQ